MFETTLKDAIFLIKNKKNPEIHHYNLGMHPGINWYIKTIIPDDTYDSDEIKPIIHGWKKLENENKHLVRITDAAVDWDGNILPGWRTIWLNHQIDVDWKIEPTTLHMVYDIVEYDIGINNGGKLVEKWASKVNEMESLPKQDTDFITDIFSFLSTFSSDKRSKINRKRLRILQDETLQS